MELLSVAGTGSRPPAGLRAARGVRPLLFVLSTLVAWTSGLSAQTLAGGVGMCRGVPAGTEIVNRAAATGLLIDGRTVTVESEPAVVTVGQFGGLELAPPRSASVPDEEVVWFHHVLRNLGNGQDTVTFTVTAPEGWTVEIYVDADADAVLDTPGDPLVDGPLPIGCGDVRLIVVVHVPPGIPTGTPHLIPITVTSGFDPSETGEVTDTITRPERSLSIRKSADRERAIAGDTLTYTLTFEAAGEAASEDVVVADSIPDGLEYVRNSLRLDGRILTDRALDGDEGQFTDGTPPIVEVFLDDLELDVPRVVTFRAAVRADVEEGIEITNTATIRGEGVPETPSEPVGTHVEAPELEIEKTVDGPEPASAGEELVWTILLHNRSTDVPARHVTVLDSLPEGLEVVSIQPQVLPNGRVLEWAVDSLDAGETVSFVVRTRVSETAQAGTIVNVARFAAPNGDEGRAETEARHILSSADARLELDLVSQVLETSIGGRVPLDLTLGNVGDVTITDLETRIALPPGTRFTGHDILPVRFNAPAGRLNASLQVVGAEGAIAPDSVRVTTDSLIVWLPGDLTPGQAIRFRYEVAVITAPAPRMLHRAVAIGRRGTSSLPVRGEVVASNDDAAAILLGRNRPMETRTALGKVWADLDGNGVQDAGEVGLAGVDVWTEDGEIATTDEEGKFSFSDIRPGRHAYRLDLATVPLAFRPDRAGEGGDLQVETSDGWTSVHVTFPLLPRSPRGARLVGPGVASDSCAGLASALASVVGVEVSCQLEPAVSDPGEPGSIGGSGPTHAPAPRTTSLDVRLRPDPVGWPQVALALPAGWEIVPGTSRLLTGQAVRDPRVAADRAGVRWAVWQDLPGEAPVELVATLREGSGAPAPDLSIPGLPPLLDEEARAAERRRDLVAGPGVSIFAPADGTLLGTDRLFVGVRGEAGHAVDLFDGDSLVATGTLRPDGVHDFIGVSLQPGPHVLRVRTVNSWSTERWDSIAVHVSGVPASFEPDLEGEVVPLVADGLQRTVVRVLVLDRWGRPSIVGQPITVEVEGASVDAPDASPGSAGHQLVPEPPGWLQIPLVAGREVGAGRLRLSVSAGADREIPLRLTAPVRDLMVTGVGEVSLGAGADAFAAVTARGRLDERTAVTVSYDSRRLDAGRESFARVTDPLEESRYTVLGDASQQRSPTPSRYNLAARIERDLDWLALGDVRTAGFGDGLRLGRYQRSLPGAAGHFRTGDVTWDAFGAMTRQGIRQVQVRGDGTSGPYVVGDGIIPGTDQVTMEVRDFENATLVVSRRVLQRFVDYQLDEESGTVMLKQPVPATDTRGNPVFVVVTYETETGADASAVWGLRASTDLSELSASLPDSVPVGVTVVRDQQTGDGFQLLAADGGVELPGVRLRGEAAWAESGDSADVATTLEARSRITDALSLEATWLSIGDRFANPSDLSLRAGTDEIRAGAAFQHGQTSVRLRHSWQSFAGTGLTRQQTLLAVDQQLAWGLSLTSSLTGDQASGLPQGGTRGGGAGQARLTWDATPRLSLWGEARRELWSEADGGLNGDHVGAGASFRVTSDLAVELAHRMISGADSADYSLTNLGVRSTLMEGMQAWGRYQITAGVSGATNAAVLGLNQRLSLGEAWTLNALVERRKGVERSPLEDPVRAQPFTRAEEDYWATGLGVEFLPPEAPYRFSIKGEAKDGSFGTSRLLTAAGDVVLDRSWAVLARQELLDRQPQSGEERRVRSLVGLAFRPADIESFNVLFKLDWMDEERSGGRSVVSSVFDRERLLVAAEAIWNPTRSFEVVARQALRHSTERLPEVGGAVPELETRAAFTGLRTDLSLHERLDVRGEVRRVEELGTGEVAWDAAPSLVIHPLTILEVQGGYRFGDLQDPDFAVRSGEGFFLTFGLHVTEASFPTIADFWREKFRSDR